MAELAGVSAGTVSRALSDHPSISAATKARIRGICRELGYVPNMAARSLVKHCSGILGLIVPDVSNPFFSEVAFEIDMTARGYGYHLLLCNSTRSEERELEAAEQILRQQVDGLIVSPASPESMERIRSLYKSLPVVYLGENHGPNCSFVTVDDELGGYLGGRYLALLGHRSAAFIGGRSSSRTNLCRVRGFLRAMDEFSCERIVAECPPDLDEDGRYGHFAMDFLRGKPPVTAVFAYSDRFAFGVMDAAGKLGLRIPEDFSLLGFDDSAYSGLPYIGLSTISQHKRRLGRLAVKRLIAKIEGEPGESSDIVKPDLIIRSSCRSLKE